MHVDKTTKSNEVVKSVNLLFSTLEPQYVWLHCGVLYEKSCQASGKFKSDSKQVVKVVGSGDPDLFEVCALTEFLLDSVSLETSLDTPSEHLPVLFHDIIVTLTQNIKHLSLPEVTTSLALCAKILSKVQPAMASPAPHLEKQTSSETSYSSGALNENNLTAIPLEKSQSDSKLNKSETRNSSGDKVTSPRRRANSSGAPKKSDKKSKKKASKSASKINDILVNTGSNISVVVNDEERPLSRNKSMDNLKINYLEVPDEQSVAKLDGSTESLASKQTPSPMPSPMRQAHCSMLEKCLRFVRMNIVFILVSIFTMVNQHIFILRVKISKLMFSIFCNFYPNNKLSFNLQRRLGMEI